MRSVNLIMNVYAMPLVSQTVRTIDGNAYLYDAEQERAKWIELNPVAENNSIWFSSELADASFIVDGQHRFDGQQLLLLMTKERTEDFPFLS